MEQQQQSTDLFSTPIRIDDTARRNINSLAQWAMIVVTTAVIGYVVSLIQAVTGSPVTETSSEGFSTYMRLGANQGIGSALFGIIIGLLINYFLYRFSVLSRKSIAASDVDQLGGSFRNLKIYFIIITIFMIIISLFAIIVVLAFI